MEHGALNTRRAMRLCSNNKLFNLAYRLCGIGFLRHRLEIRFFEVDFAPDPMEAATTCGGRRELEKRLWISLMVTLKNAFPAARWKRIFYLHMSFSNSQEPLLIAPIE